MVWPLVLMAVGAAQSAVKASSDYELSKIRSDANYKISEVTRKANNNYRAAAGNLNRQRQIIRNNFQLQNNAKAIDAAQVNFERAMAATQEGSLDQQIRSAEQAGALRAQQAYLGGGGSTMEMLSMTNALREARVEQMASDQKKQVTADFNQQVNDAHAGMLLGIEGLDMVDDLNVAETVKELIPKPNYVGIAAGFITGAITSGAAGDAVSFFKSKKKPAGSSGLQDPNSGSGFAGY
jgi:hypothetical protein